jgi:hypothetical protein
MGCCHCCWWYRLHLLRLRHQQWLHLLDGLAAHCCCLHCLQVLHPSHHQQQWLHLFAGYRARCWSRHHNS